MNWFVKQDFSSEPILKLQLTWESDGIRSEGRSKHPLVCPKNLWREATLSAVQLSEMQFTSIKLQLPAPEHLSLCPMSGSKWDCTLPACITNTLDSSCAAVVDQTT